MHNKFSDYLKTQKLSENERERIIACVEGELPNFIRTYFDDQCGDLYENTDHNYYKSIRQKVFTNKLAKQENDNSGSLLTNALKHYTSFLDSKFFKGREKVHLTAKEKVDRKKKQSTSNTESPTSSAVKVYEADPLLPPMNPSDELVEGRIRQVNITSHERNQNLRQRCLEHFGYVCQVCKMNFEQRYGEIGKNFIEVHHLNPISNTDGEHEVDPVTELVPLCSNCHSMIHRGGKDGQPMKLDDLIEVFNSKNQ